MGGTMQPTQETSDKSRWRGGLHKKWLVIFKGSKVLKVKEKLMNYSRLKRSEDRQLNSMWALDILFL
jgi:hypothetical protein